MDRWVRLVLLFVCWAVLVLGYNSDLELWQAVFDSTNGPEWDHCNQNRNTPCTCLFVRCANNDTTIEEIFFGENNLKGTLPALVSPNLRAFVAIANKLNGTIPPLQAPRLVKLALQHGMLSGTIPSLELVPSLCILALNDNALQGTIPSSLGQLVMLQDLQLQFNQLEGELPDLSLLTNLFLFSVKNNQLTGGLPDLNPLGLLMTAWLNSNRFTGTIPSFANHQSLMELDVSNNLLTGTIPPLINLPSFEHLSVGHNSLTGTIPQPRGVPWLTFLIANDNQLHGLIPRFDNTSLAVLALQNNNLEGTIPQLDLLSDLTILQLSRNQLTGTLPPFQTDSLVNVMVHSNNLRGTIPPLVHLTSLRVLTLFGNDFWGTIPPLPNSLFSPAVDMFVTFSYFHNNRLSCALPNYTKPHDVEQLNPNSKGLVALGNFFSMTTSGLPWWLYEFESDAKFLFAAHPSLAIVFGTSVVLGFLLFFLTMVVGARTTNSLAFAIAPTIFHSHNRVVVLLRRLMVICSVLSLVGVIGLVPAFFVAANLYQCGESLNFTTMSDVQDTPVSERIIAVLLCVISVVSIVSLLWLLGQHAPRINDCTLSVALQQLELSDVSSQPLASSQHHTHSTPRHRQLILSGIRGITAAMLWVAGLAFLSAPAAAGEILDSLPSFPRVSAGALRWIRIASAPLLAVFNTLLVPIFCRAVVRVAFGASANCYHTLKSRTDALILLTRTLLLLVLPALVVFVLDNQCHQLWKLAWEPCREGNVFDSQTIDTLDFIPSVQVTTNAEICEPRYSNENGRCARRIVAFTSTLLLFKMCTQAFIGPAAVLLWHLKLRSFAIHNRRTRWLFSGLSRVPKWELGPVAISWVETAIVYAGVAPLVGVMVVVALCTHLSAAVVLGHAAQHPAVVLEGENIPVLHLCLAVVLQTLLGCWTFVSAKFQLSMFVVVALFGFLVVLAFALVRRSRQQN